MICGYCIFGGWWSVRYACEKWLDSMLCTLLCIPINRIEIYCFLWTDIVAMLLRWQFALFASYTLCSHTKNCSRNPTSFAIYQPWPIKISP